MDKLDKMRFFNFIKKNQNIYGEKIKGKDK
jgi:hypothetical protein